jgi:hypothetical protein
MTRTANAITKFDSTSDPADLEQLFGPPSVLTDTEAKRHRQIFRAFAQLVEPRDVIEWMLIWDLAASRTELQRLQRLMPRIIQKAHEAYSERRAMPIALDAGDKERRVLDGLDAELKAEIKNLKCKPEEVKAQIEALKAVRIEKIRSECRTAIQELTEEHAADIDCAASFRAWIDDYERANKCLALEQKKYDQTLRQLEDYRGGLAERLRRANDTIIEGEFQEDIVEERRTPAPELASAAAIPVDEETTAAAASANGLVGAAPATVAALPDIADDEPAK